MKTDLLLIPFGTAYRELREAALAAEEAGFDGVWTWDHLRVADGGGGGVPECLATLAGLAEATSRVQLGSLVLNVNTRHPGLVANMAATIQEISGGRLILGIGAGGGLDTPYARELQALGIAVEPDPMRRGRAAEAVQVLQRLWRGDISSFAGRHFRLERPSGFLRPQLPPPIVVGGFGPRMAAVAGRYADGFNTQAVHPQLEQLIQIARDARAQAGHETTGFEISVFAGLAVRWLAATSPARAHLERLGVGRLILLVEPPYPLAQIREAGAMLSR